MLLILFNEGRQPVAPVIPLADPGVGALRGVGDAWTFDINGKFQPVSWQAAGEIEAAALHMLLAL